MSAPTYESIARAAAPHCLDIMGGVPDGGGTVILLGPTPAFWALLHRAPEWLDRGRDPIDRWSRRVIANLADRLGSEALFPFGGPPYQPFLRWAMASKRAWQSPAGMLVHESAGLMVSYRGALRFAQEIALPPVGPSPCASCAGQPCMHACPVDALSAKTGYDTAACHGYLNTEAGQDCLTQGCKARRACPISQSFGRDPQQSAHHMRYFHPH